MESQGAQFHGTWLADKSQPLPGTARSPQGRLFAPVGQYRGDPMRLHPENWMRQSESPAHGDIISWHASESSQLPRYDSPEMRQVDPYEHEGADWDNPEFDDEGEYNEDYRDWSVDEKDRPMAGYGSAVGMHFGDVKAGMDRDSARDWSHPARIPASTLAAPPRGTFREDRPGGGVAGGDYRSQQIIRNKETGEETKDTRWTDQAANFASKATDLVESGKTLAYRNDIEAAGSTSYRTLPETARTWSEDVLGTRHPETGYPAVRGERADDEHGFRNVPHPALVHLAQQGYNPVQQRQRGPTASNEPDVQLSFAFNAPDRGYAHGTMVSDAMDQRVSREAHFNQGRAWALRKPEDEDAW